MDNASVAEAVVDRVQARLDRQFDYNDALDAKCFGLLGADAAAIGVLVAVHDSINRYWAIPAIALGVSAIFLMYVIYPRKLDAGPNWREFYEKFGGANPLDASLQMLTELLLAVEANDATVPAKDVPFKIGFVVMAFGLLGTLLVGLVH